MDMSGTSAMIQMMASWHPKWLQIKGKCNTCSLKWRGWTRNGTSPAHQNTKKFHILTSVGKMIMMMLLWEYQSPLVVQHMSKGSIITSILYGDLLWIHFRSAIRSKYHWLLCSTVLLQHCAMPLTACMTSVMIDGIQKSVSLIFYTCLIMILGRMKEVHSHKTFDPMKKCRRWRIGGYICSQRTCFTSNPGISEKPVEVHQTQRPLCWNGEDVLNATALNQPVKIFKVFSWLTFILEAPEGNTQLIYTMENTYCNYWEIAFPS